MDKFIIRFSIIALNAYILIVLSFALNGIDISEYDFIFTDSLLFGIVLTVLCLSQGRYHCKWIRFLCYNLIICPTVNFLDFKFGLFSDISFYIYFICGIMLIGIFATIVLAILHFRKVRKVINDKKNLHVTE